MATYNRAFDRSGEAGIDPVTSEKQPRNRRVNRRSLWLPRSDRKRRALFTNDNGPSQLGLFHSWQRDLQLAKRQVYEFLVGLADERCCPARDERKMRAGLAEQRPFIEHPLHRATRQPNKG